MNTQDYGHTGAAGPGCVTLMGVPFLGAGLIISFVMLRDLSGGSGESGEELLLQIVAAALFSGAGVALIAWGRYGARKEKEAGRLKQMHPDSPWLWDEEWASGRIQGSARGMMIFSWIFAAFWNLISAPLLFVVPREMESGNEYAWIGLIFPVVGLGLLAWAVQSAVRYRKFGASVFEMHTLPGVIGGPVRGVIHTRLKPGATPRLNLMLTAVHRRRSRGTNRSHTSEKVLWQDERELPAASVYAGADGLDIPIDFRIPAGAPETDVSDPYSQILWRLEVHAGVAGVDYLARFNIPVFKTAESSEEAVSYSHSAFDSASAAAGAFDPSQATIEIRPHPLGGTEYYFGRARNRTAAIGITMFALLWAGAIWLLIRLEAPVFFTIFFALFELLLLIGVLDMWFGETSVIISSEGVTVANRTLGVGSRKHLDCKEVERVSLKVGMSQGQSVTQSAKAYWDLQIIPKNGKPLKAGGAIRNKREAEWLAGRMEKDIAAYA